MSVLHTAPKYKEQAVPRPGTTISKARVPWLLQEVIDNLMICRVEHRTESDSEVVPHVHQKDVRVEVRGGAGVVQ